MPARTHGLSRDTTGNLTPVYRAWAAPLVTPTILRNVPILQVRGWSTRSIAACTGVGKTVVEKILRGDYRHAIEHEGRLYTLEVRRGRT
jgi:hypothetical protein